jgi:pyrrolidone-carboxylate peptidase
MFFDVPDQRGKQPKGDSISSSNDSSLTTSLPLSAILAEFKLNLQSIGAENEDDLTNDTIKIS